MLFGEVGGTGGRATVEKKCQRKPNCPVFCGTMIQAKPGK